MFSTYRATLALPGARVLTLACALAWLATSASSLGLILLIEDATDSFATAGSGAAAYALGAALLAPWRGRLVDRRGVRALFAVTAAHVTILGLTAIAAGQVAARGAVALLLCAGASAPPLIAVARTRWAQLAAPLGSARPGHALNAVLGDASSVLGPVLVAGIAVLAGPAVAVAGFLPAFVIAAALLGRQQLAAEVSGNGPDQRPVEAVAGGREHRPSRGIPGGPGFRMLLATETLLAVAFGALDLAAPAAGAQQGSPGLGAAALAAFAAGSVVAGLWSGARPRIAVAHARLVAGLAVATGAFAGASMAPTVAVLALACVPAGIGVGLAFVAVLELLDDVVPASRATEAFTWLTAGGGAGAAVGAAAAGHLAAAGRPGLAVALCAGAAAAATGWATVAPHRTAARRPDPACDQREAPTSSRVG